MNIRNIVTVFSLSIVYFLSLFLRDYSPLFVLVGLPIVVGLLGYNIIVGKPIVKRALPGLVPVFSLVWVFFFLELEEYVGLALGHCIIISSLVVQIWEVCDDCFKVVVNVFRRVRKTVINFRDSR